MVWYGTGEVFFQGLDPADTAGVLAEWEKTLTKMAKWKFNTVRLPFRRDILYNYRSLFVQIIDKIVAHNMKVILDYHNDFADSPFFGSPEWIAVWQELAMIYKGNPNIVAFELFNEPFIKGSWYPGVVNNYPDIFTAYATCTDAIRAIDPSRTVIWSDPLLCNVLPSEDGFHGWFGHIIENYIGYADNMYFSFHRYPPITAPPDKPWKGIQMFFNAVDYVTAKGFKKVWLGEFGPLTGFSDEENRSFVLQCINFCVSKGVGFSLWEYRTDHYCTSGLYDDVLAQSNYKPPSASPLWLIPAGIVAFLGLVWAATRKGGGDKRG